MSSRRKILPVIFLCLLQILAEVGGQGPNCSDSGNYKCGCRWMMPLQVVGEKGYYLGTYFKANWYKAAEYCRFHGLHLASISSQEENDGLEKYIRDSGFAGETFWTSGNDLAAEGTFVWMSSGRRFTYTNWWRGQPDNNGFPTTSENCLQVLWENDKIWWNDQGCSYLSYFVCEGRND